MPSFILDSSNKCQGEREIQKSLLLLDSKTKRSSYK